MPQTYTLKLGGSMVSPTQDCLFDFPFARELKNTLSEFTQIGDKFFITVGGGSLMRQYRDLAIANGITDAMQIHWIGTTVNVLNAEVVRVSMGELADAGVYKYDDYYNEEKIDIVNGIKVGGGGKPGHSGDVDTIMAARKLGSKTIISLKNIDAVYTSDPKTDPCAKPLERITWSDYLGIIGNPTEHKPGANFPIDPIASQMAIESGLRFIVIGGKDMENFRRVLRGESFKGTIVE